MKVMETQDVLQAMAEVMVAAERSLACSSVM